MCHIKKLNENQREGVVAWSWLWGNGPLIIVSLSVPVTSAITFGIISGA